MTTQEYVDKIAGLESFIFGQKLELRQKNVQLMEMAEVVDVLEQQVANKFGATLSLLENSSEKDNFERWFNGEFLPMFSTLMIHWFESSGGVNVVETTVTAEDGVQYLLSLQKKTGKPFSDLFAESNVQKNIATNALHKIDANDCGYSDCDTFEQLRFRYDEVMNIVNAAMTELAQLV